jgi:DHA2 family multidrug resistance protein-like MFS transporter
VNAQQIAAPGAPRATRREWIGLGVLALPCVLYSMDLTVLNLAVPLLAEDLKPSPSQLLWIVDIYGFLLAGALITMGTLGDRIGRRRLLMIGATVFGIVSVLAAFAPTPRLLIAARALLGLAAATLAPSTLSLIRNMFLDDRQRTLAIGIWGASFSAGAAIGPFVGGLLLERFWWGSVFLASVPVMALLLILGPRLLPEFRDPQCGRMDIVSAALSVGAVLSVIYGIKRMAETLSFSAEQAVFIALGLALAVVFVRRQLHLADPLIDLAMFRIRALRASLSINVIGLFAAFGFFLLIAQYFQIALGMGPLEAGLWSAPSGPAFVLGSLLTPALAHRMPPANLLAGAFFVAAVGLLIIAYAIVHPGMAVFMTGYVAFCFGIAPMGTLTTDIVMSTAPPERAGAASGISETSFELGGALGIALLGSFVTAIYRSATAGIAPIAGVDITPLKETLAGAVTLARELPPEVGGPLLEVARQAFAGAFTQAAFVAAAFCVIAAILSLVFLRRPSGAR